MVWVEVDYIHIIVTISSHLFIYLLFVSCNRNNRDKYPNSIFPPLPWAERILCWNSCFQQFFWSQQWTPRHKINTFNFAPKNAEPTLSAVWNQVFLFIYFIFLWQSSGQHIGCCDCDANVNGLWLAWCGLISLLCSPQRAQSTFSTSLITRGEMRVFFSALLWWDAAARPSRVKWQVMARRVNFQKHKSIKENELMQWKYLFVY